MVLSVLGCLTRPLASVAMLAACVVASGQDTQSTSKNEITFTSWPGPYMRSQMPGFVRPYEKKHNVRVLVASYNGGIEEIRNQVESAIVLWNVIPMGFWIDSQPERQWQSWRTIFYWGWWIAWCPFVVVFTARVSKGRTIRQFCL